MTTSKEDYAALSAAAYNAARLEFNQLVLPTGWSQIDQPTNPVNGFGAQAYQKVIKGVSIALLLEQSCHAAHALD